MKKIFYSLSFLVLVILVLSLAAKANFYPVIRLDGEFVGAGDYYERMNGLKRYAQMTAEPFDEKTIGRGIILSLITDELVKKESENRKISADEAHKLVEEVLDSGFENLEKASAELYGWDIEEFKKLVLLPQARQDLLAEALQKEGIDFNKWLSEELARSEIKIYFLPYRWQDGQLVEK